jgi:alanine-glyoxylate transaminase/serine-glyoxylate transaminase/serine-pyruvate transaminase
MSKHTKLFTPGPGDVEEDVLAALAAPVIRHYGPEWMAIYNETQELLRLFFKTKKNDIYFVPGPASASLDMAIGSLIPSGGKIIAGTNGFFGDRFTEMAQCYGIEAVPFSAPLGQPLDPEALRGLLKTHPDASLVAIVHHETGTTVLNPLRELAAVVKEAGRMLLVDAVSSLGAVEVDVDGWGIDICVTAANKCLESVPGMGFMSISPRAWRAVDSHPGTGHGWYLNLRTWRKCIQDWGDWHPSPVTTSVNTTLAVLTSMRRIAAGGLEAHYAKYARASQAIRGGLEALGFEMFVPAEYASTVVNGVKKRPEFEVSEMIHWLAENRSIAISGAFGELEGRIFRVGNLGKAAERDYLIDLLFSIEEFLRYKGIPVPTGAGLAHVK